MSFYIYQTTSGVGGVGNRALGGPIEALGPVEDFESLGLFDPRGSSWFPLLNQLVEALEAWLLCVGCPCPGTEIISSNKLADLLGIEILEL